MPQLFIMVISLKLISNKHKKISEKITYNYLLSALRRLTNAAMGCSCGGVQEKIKSISKAR